MKFHLFLCLLFAFLIFVIPLAALQFDLPEPNQAAIATDSQQKNPIQPETNPAPPENTSAPVQSDTPATLKRPAETSSAAAPEFLDSIQDADSFLIYNLTAGKTERVSAYDYVLGSVCAEMPPSFHPEALKAQAVASHTYALRAQRDSKDYADPALQGADFTADPSNWKGYVTKKQFLERYPEKGETYFQAIKSAVDEVADLVIVYQDTPIVAAYHSMSSGRTEDASNVWKGSAPYLVPVDSQGDLLAPKYETAEIFTPETIRQLLTAQYPDLILPESPSDWFTNPSRSASGYVTSLQVGNQTIEGKDLRTLLGLRSTDMEIQYINGSFVFTVMGYGHGVGMSQYGADYLARQGQTYDQILRHYYTGVDIVKVK